MNPCQEHTASPRRPSLSTLKPSMMRQAEAIYPEGIPLNTTNRGSVQFHAWTGRGTYRPPKFKRESASTKRPRRYLQRECCRQAGPKASDFAQNDARPFMRTIATAVGRGRGRAGPFGVEGLVSRPPISRPPTLDPRRGQAIGHAPARSTPHARPMTRGGRPTGSAGQPVEFADLLVEGPGGNEAAQGADASGRRAGGVPQLRLRVGGCRDDRPWRRWPDRRRPPSHVRHHVVECLPLLRVDRQRCVGLHGVRVEAGPGVGGLDEQHPDAVLADLVVHRLGVALDRVLGRGVDWPCTARGRARARTRC